LITRPSRDSDASTPPKPAHKSLVDEIVSTLADEIIASKFEPGARILHQDLTRRFNVSLGPIREALLKLEQERLVEIIPRRGARVVQLTLEQIEDLMAVRCAIYPVLARGATLRGDDATLAQARDTMHRVAKSLRRSAPYREIQKNAYAAREMLAQAAANNWAGTIVRSSVRQPNWVYGARSVESAAEREQAATVWENLGDALVSRDPERAASAAEAVVLRAVTTVLPKLYEDHGIDASEASLRRRLFPATR